MSFRWNQSHSLREFKVKADGSPGGTFKATAASEAASQFFKAEAQDGRYPRECRVGPVVFRNHHQRPPDPVAPKERKR